MSRLSRKFRRRSPRVRFCDECSQVITARDCNRELIESARVRALHGARTVR